MAEPGTLAARHGFHAVMTRTVPDIRAALIAFLDVEAAALGLGDPPFDVSYVPNPGGFVNANFTLRSERATWHCKLAHPRSRHELRRWWDLREPLAARFRSPEMVAWIDLGIGGLQGAILEHVPGVRAHHAAAASLWSSVGSLAEALHRDPALAETLRASDPVGSCLEYLERTYLEMLEADVVETRIHDETPPFVPSSFWDWVLEEVEVIRAAAARSAAFQRPADAVVHGDLWEGNVLVSGPEWWIVDWDEVGFGDPAKDLTDWWWSAGSFPPPQSKDLAARLPLWRRARLLVDAVDPLADWAEAVVAPDEVRAEMRARSRRVHEAGLGAYRERYGSG